MFAISHGIILFFGSYRKQMHMVPTQPWLLLLASRSQTGLQSNFWTASSTHQGCYKTQQKKADKNCPYLVHMLDVLWTHCLVLPIFFWPTGTGKSGIYIDGTGRAQSMQGASRGASSESLCWNHSNSTLGCLWQLKVFHCYIDWSHLKALQ